MSSVALPCCHRLLRSSSFAALSLALACTAVPLARAQAWIAPTQEELKMTSLPEQPGAKAVVLNVDETTDDDNHMRSFYRRIKILSDAGKDLGDVRIVFDKRNDGYGYTVDEVAGRTIQPDGTIVPFTGKPYEKMLEKTKEDSFRGKVFSLPAVQVGSIIEYRYKLRWEDHIYSSPFWDVQDEDLYVRKGHFLWKPTDKELQGRGRGGRESYTSSLVWHPVLPKGQEIKNTHLPNGRLLLELNVHDVPAYSSEEYMPPMASSIYHVNFYYSQYHSAPEFWTTEGKYWSQDSNKFIGSSGYVRDEAMKAVAGATTDEDKVRKLYALAQSIENTSYTRKRDAAEMKAANLKEVKSAEDVLRRMQGTDDQIAQTFVALVRAAGLKASLMACGDRSRNMVDVNWLDFQQMRDEIAIVNYGGSDHFFDPGSPFVPFGHLDWRHTFSGGVRQTEGNDTAIVQTAMESYKFSKTARIAELKLDPTGKMSGLVTMRFEGNPAVKWRQRALKTDNTELREDLKKHLERMMPGGTEVTVRGIDGLKETDQPLRVVFAVEGHLGTPAGSRVVLPADIFVAGSHSPLPHEHREQPVYFDYAQITQDAMRVNVPAGYTIESAPPDERTAFKNLAMYVTRSKQDATGITLWRDFTMGEFYFPLTEYKELRDFYGAMEQKDHGSVVLKRASTEKASLQ